MTTLSKDDIPQLKRTLVMCAYKWRELGVALGFDPAELDYFEKSYATHPKSCLWEVLIRWIRDPEKPNRHSATVENLVTALRSVGLETISDNIRSIFQKRQIPGKNLSIMLCNILFSTYGE